jgi:hypothetical protein
MRVPLIQAHGILHKEQRFLGQKRWAQCRRQVELVQKHSGHAQSSSAASSKYNTHIKRMTTGSESACAPAIAVIRASQLVLVISWQARVSHSYRTSPASPHLLHHNSFSAQHRDSRARQLR